MTRKKRKKGRPSGGKGNGKRHLGLRRITHDRHFHRLSGLTPTFKTRTKPRPEPGEVTERHVDPDSLK